MADPHPASNEDKAPTPGSLPPAKVEHRENVGTATPEDYPKADREDGDVAASGHGERQADEQDRGPAGKHDAGAGGGRKRTYSGDRRDTDADAPVDEH